MNFEDKCITFIIDEIEKGYVNNPDDPGGETKYGISKRSYPDLDIKNLTKSEALRIYKRDYASKVKFQEIALVNPYLALCVLDFAINSGPSRAIKSLQTSGRVTADGIIGPATLAASGKPDACERYLAERARFLAGLKNFQINGNGWMWRLFTLSKFRFI